MDDETVRVIYSKSRSYHTETAAIEAWQETERQVKKWGVQHHPDFVQWYDSDPVGRCIAYGVPFEDAAKEQCQTHNYGKGDDWAAILIEEVSEAISAVGADIRKELIQVAAVVLSWVADIDERTGA